MSDGILIVHGIDRITQHHLCGQVEGCGTDAISPAMEITCPLCRLVLERRRPALPRRLCDPDNNQENR